jgi:hypothetical protein
VTGQQRISVFDCLRLTIVVRRLAAGSSASLAHLISTKISRLLYPMQKSVWVFPSSDHWIVTGGARISVRRGLGSTRPGIRVECDQIQRTDPTLGLKVATEARMAGGDTPADLFATLTSQAKTALHRSVALQVRCVLAVEGG